MAEAPTAPLTTMDATHSDRVHDHYTEPADRIIYATAIEHGWRIVTKDRRMQQHRHPRPMTMW